MTYPATALNRMAPVTRRGERLVALAWAPSVARNAAAQEILFDLDTARHAVFEREGKGTSFDLVSKSHANLLQRWADM